MKFTIDLFVTFRFERRHACEVHHRKAWSNMAAKKYHFIPTILLIIILCTNMLNVQSVLADGETPTEPPAATQVATHPPTVSTSEPVQATSVPEEATTTPVAEILTQVPESTEVVVLDESGNSVPLASQEAAEIAAMTDPMWCPAGVLPGGQGCSINFTGATAITNLINSMISNPNYTSDIIYFTATTGQQTVGAPFTLTATGLGSTNFDKINDVNLTLQGGWNGQNGGAATFTGQTNFGNNAITIGSVGSGNLWAGNVTLSNFTFNRSEERRVGKECRSRWSP